MKDILSMNALTGWVLSITLIDFETFMKIVLIGVTIGYTAYKWYKESKKK